MGIALSPEFCKRLVRAVEKGGSCRAVAARFEVAESTVIKLMQRFRATGSVAPKQIGGYRKPALRGQEDRIAALLGARPDMTYAELARALGGSGPRVGLTTVWRFVRALGWTRKKRRFTPPSKSGRTSPPRATLGGRAKRG
jgi:putative transposase